MQKGGLPVRDRLLAQSYVSTRLMVLTLNCWQNPEASSRVLKPMEDLSAKCIYILRLSCYTFAIFF